jgi:hypothetical protein
MPPERVKLFLSHTQLSLLICEVYVVCAVLMERSISRIVCLSLNKSNVHSFPSLHKQINAVPQETKKKDRVKLSLNRRDIIKLRYPDVS